MYHEQFHNFHIITKGDCGCTLGLHTVHPDVRTRGERMLEQVYKKQLSNWLKITHKIHTNTDF